MDQRLVCFVIVKEGQVHLCYYVFGRLCNKRMRKMTKQDYVQTITLYVKKESKGFRAAASSVNVFVYVVSTNL